MFNVYTHQALPCYRLALCRSPDVPTRKWWRFLLSEVEPIFYVTCHCASSCKKLINVHCAKRRELTFIKTNGARRHLAGIWTNTLKQELGECCATTLIHSAIPKAANDAGTRYLVLHYAGWSCFFRDVRQRSSYIYKVSVPKGKAAPLDGGILRHKMTEC
eukprot:7304-Heterococcus_DN1.PRE.3